MTVWGTEDVIIPVSHAENVHQELPDSIVRVIPECGHWPHMEKPAQFNQMLVSFLNGDPVELAQLES